MKPIRLSAHTSRYVPSRGFTVTEVEEAIRNARWEAAELGRLACRQDFPYAKMWNGTVYATK